LKLLDRIRHRRVFTRSDDNFTASVLVADAEQSQVVALGAAACENQFPVAQKVKENTS